MVLFFYLLFLSCLCSTSKAAIFLLKGKKATQSGNSGHAATLAIDGNVDTYSMATSPRNDSSVGWWEVDLGEVLQINTIIITEAESNQYLREFSVWLWNKEKNRKQLCISYPNSQSLSFVYFPCGGDPFPTRYIKIVRHRYTERSDTIALGEVIVDAVYPPERVLKLIGKKATQSGNLQSHPANNAIDGNLDTFSLAESTKDKFTPGWWEVDLGEDFQIVEVIITASKNAVEAKYLQHFSILLLAWKGARGDLLCSSFNEGPLPRSEKKIFTCGGYQYPTRYIKIIRNEGATFRPDAISLAEVEVKTKTLPSITSTSKSANEYED